MIDPHVSQHPEWPSCRVELLPPEVEPFLGPKTCAPDAGPAVLHRLAELRQLGSRSCLPLTHRASPSSEQLPGRIHDGFFDSTGRGLLGVWDRDVLGLGEVFQYQPAVERAYVAPLFGEVQGLGAIRTRR